MATEPTIPTCVLQAIEPVRAAFPDLVGIVMFGSHARGRARPHSDIDLLLALPTGADVHRGLYDLWDAALPGIDRRITPHFARIPTDPTAVGGLWKEIAHEGIVVWDRDARMNACLAAMRDAVARAGDRRAVVHGHPYWIRGHDERGTRT